ncbi:hypothetical protein H5410_033709 [Solanum commersonii]|uniref:Uncharacterized protein n=1 Tax=Solanum commersonii TaxID=4109 RepID=A0A9J5YNL7_SOLCO|nr:hypothetical protein H5410_033709 [Solanum commersonii]
MWTERVKSRGRDEFAVGTRKRESFHSSHLFVVLAFNFMAAKMCSGGPFLTSSMANNELLRI